MKTFIIFSLQISVKTWLKNSYDLIDYDSDILVKEKLKLKQSQYIYREYNDIYSKTELISNDEDIEKLMKIDVYQNEIDTYFEFERNKYGVDETDNITTPNSSWFLLKPSMTEDKMNKYKLSQGEIIKLGRITMRIRDIIFEGKNKYNISENSSLNESLISKDNKEFQTLKTEGGKIGLLFSNMKKSTFRNKNLNYDKIDTDYEKKEKIKLVKKQDLKKNFNIYSKLEKKNKICRICYSQEEDENNNPLVQPCNCDGSMKYIHLQCLSQWIYTHSCEKLEANNNCSIYLLKPIECELCKTKFPDYIKIKNRFFPLINFTNDYKSYLTLESLTLDKYRNKFIYVVSLETKRKIPIGKNHSCEIVLSDRSIENLHCFMVVSNKQVYLEDNDSKFGSLVLVQTKRIKLYQDIPLYLQIGRSFLEILIKKDFKLFDCCVSDDKNNIYTYFEQNEKYIKKDMALVVKNEDEESESFANNNVTQEVHLYDFANNSVNIGKKDKISESEYLQIKRHKRNKNLKKNIYNSLTHDKKEGDENFNDSYDEKENHVDEKHEKNKSQENKKNNESLEEIEIENVSENKANENDNEDDNIKIENKQEIKYNEESNRESQLIDSNNKDQKNLVEDIKSLHLDEQNENIQEIENNLIIESNENNDII